MRKELLAIPAALWLAYEASRYAFTRDVAYEVFKRDEGTCQCCGRSWYDGWRLDMAHQPEWHGRKNEEGYNDPEAGRALCLDCHRDEHIDMGDFESATLVQRRIDQHGGLRDGYHLEADGPVKDPPDGVRR